jgi:hypothetical protein
MLIEELATLIYDAIVDLTCSECPECYCEYSVEDYLSISDVERWLEKYFEKKEAQRE